MPHPTGSTASPVNPHRPRSSAGFNTTELSDKRTQSGQGGTFGGFGDRDPNNPNPSLDQNLRFTGNGIRDLLRELQGFGGGGGGGGGTQRQNIIDLDPFKSKELDAMRELLRQQTEGARTELSGNRARIGNAFQRFEALRNKKLRDSMQANRGSAQRRGFLDSGVFLKDAAELQNVAAGDISSEDQRSSALVDALSRQIGGEFDYLGRGSEDYGVGTLEALRSAQQASSTADIERSYLNARISQGGQG